MIPVQVKNKMLDSLGEITFSGGSTPNLFKIITANGTTKNQDISLSGGATVAFKAASNSKKELNADAVMQHNAGNVVNRLYFYSFNNTTPGSSKEICWLDVTSISFGSTNNLTIHKDTTYFELT